MLHTVRLQCTWDVVHGHGVETFHHGDDQGVRWQMRGPMRQLAVEGARSFRMNTTTASKLGVVVGIGLGASCVEWWVSI